MFSSLLISHRILPLIKKYGNPDGGTFTHVPLSHGNLPLIKKSENPDGGDIHPCPPSGYAPECVYEWKAMGKIYERAIDGLYGISEGAQRIFLGFFYNTVKLMHTVYIQN